MSIEFQLEDNQLRVSPGKQFDYTLVNAFFDGINGVADNVKSIVVDCACVQYADSAAIGMILQLNERYPHTPLTIAQCKEQVYRLFYIARFDRQFTVTHYEHDAQPLSEQSGATFELEALVA